MKKIYLFHGKNGIMLKILVSKFTIKLCKYNVYLTHMTEKEQLDAVRRYGNAIRHIKNPSEAVQLTAVNENGYAIIPIENPIEAVQLAAVNQNGFAIELIKNPAVTVQMLVKLLS